MTRHMFLILAVATLLAEAHAEPLRARVVDEAGRPIASAHVESGGTTLGVDAAGRFELPGDALLVQVRATADGYYDFVHTFGRDDGAVADIVLVERRPGRRLLLFAGDTMLSRRYFEPREG